MNRYIINSQGLDDLSWDNMAFEADKFEVEIIFGNSGVGKTEIVKQFLSRKKANKLYIDGFVDCNLLILNKYNDYIVVFEEIENMTANDYIEFIKESMNHSKNGKVIIITNKIEKSKILKKTVEEKLACNNENFEAVFIEVKPCFNSDYLHASTVYGNKKGIEKIGPKGLYWGEEEISNITC
jgi:hypothetical protein